MASGFLVRTVAVSASCLFRPSLDRSFEMFVLAYRRCPNV